MDKATKEKLVATLKDIAIEIVVLVADRVSQVARGLNKQ